jgi:hypothetical protein
VKNLRANGGEIKYQVIMNPEIPAFEGLIAINRVLTITGSYYMVKNNFDIFGIKMKFSFP